MKRKHLATIVNYNPSNRLIRHNARKLIRDNPLTYRLWKDRTAILHRQTKVAVAPEHFRFFVEYAKLAQSPSEIVIDEHAPIFRAPEIRRSIALMYSGGSESILLDSMFHGVDCISGYNFYPYKAQLREFQIGLLGMTLGYRIIMVGVQGEWQAIDSHLPFEYTFDFVNLWNTTFPTTLQYPITIPKHEVYFNLFNRVDPDDGTFYNSKRPLNIITCEAKNSPCGKCWKCAEQYFNLEALRHFTEWDDKIIYRYPLDDAAKLRFRRENQRWVDRGIDPFGSIEIFRLLENDWGYMGWRMPKDGEIAYGWDPVNLQGSN